MQRLLNRLLEALTLLIAMGLLVVISHLAISTAPQVKQSAATPSPTATVTDTPTATTPPSPTPSPTATFTPTPTPTAPPTQSPTNTPTMTPHPPRALPPPAVIATATPNPAMTSTPNPIPVPAQMPLIEQPDQTINILLLGSDQQTIDSIGRTDTIVIASINPDIPSVSLLSIPRDFYAWVPSHGFKKINTAFTYGARDGYPGGGPGLLKATIEYNFGIRIHYYARVAFNSFIRIVDALGGVDVAVECELHDTFPDPEAPDGRADIDLLPGIHHLDGKHALWYARSRWSTSDFDRHRRQQQVLRGMYRQAMSLNVIPKLSSLWGTLNENVSTDLGLDELLYLGAVGSRLDMLNVKSRFVGGSVVDSWTAPNGAYVLVPDYEALGELVQEALAPPARARAQQPAFRVEVWNATRYDGLGHVAAERLRWEGLAVTSVESVEGSYPRTKILDFTTTSKGSPIYRLMRLYKRTNDDIISEPTEGSEVDFRVILGADYNPCAATK